VSTQLLTPLFTQAISPAGHPQMAFVHVPPTAHDLPHMPQFAGSVCVFVQTPKH
jgi:hypothetical protein